MPAPLWTRIGKVNSFNHRELEPDDVCLFLHTRETHAYGEIEQWSYPYRTVENFKISPHALSAKPARRKYKEEAVRIVADDLAMLFRDSDPYTKLLLVPAVTSKAKSDPNYDDRLPRVCEMVASRFPNVDWVELLSARQTIASAHTGDGTRDVDALLANIAVVPGFPVGDYASVLIFDDVISSGAHFKACERAIKSVYGEHTPVKGVFWSRTASWGEPSFS